MEANTRHIGIRPRIKQTAVGEARPTQVVIIGPGEVKASYDLEDEQAELDFVLGVYPTGYRKAVQGEDVSKFRDHHIVRGEDGNPVEVPAGYEGLRSGDTVALSLGGLGDRLAFALSRQGEKLQNVWVARITPFLLKRERGSDDMTGDAGLLAALIHLRRELFTPVYVRDRQIVRVRELQRLRVDTMKARIGCDQRLRQSYIGRIFCSPDGLFPEGAIEEAFDKVKASDVISENLRKEEARADRELAKAVSETEIWQKVLSDVEGCGPAIAARLISVIQDIRRFEKKAKLRKYLGVFVDGQGRFARRRVGELAGWSNEGRQALFLLIDQMNRRPDSVWGKKLRENKEYLRFKFPHPELVFDHEGKERSIALVPGSFEKKGSQYSLLLDGVRVEVSGKQRHTKAHIHKMAGWRTAWQFINWL
ncbi:MAG: transposase, partial [Patescibacteria group bacterium]|nr:transposase [Patescibacteria group bacterium]